VPVLRDDREVTNEAEVQVGGEERVAGVGAGR
jgi:hypothetical protein